MMGGRGLVVCIRCQDEDLLNQHRLGAALGVGADGIKEKGVSLWPAAKFMLLNLDQFIYTEIESEREREWKGCYPSLLYIHEPASEVPSPLATQAPPRLFVARHMTAIWVQGLNICPYRLPAGSICVHKLG